jgi:hypothetical protein
VKLHRNAKRTPISALVVERVRPDRSPQDLAQELEPSAQATPKGIAGLAREPPPLRPPDRVIEGQAACPKGR